MSARDPLLPNALVIARREYVERIRSRLFAGSTVVLMTIAIFVALSPLALRAASAGRVATIHVASADPALAGTTATELDRVLNLTPAGADPATFRKPFQFDTVENAEFEVEVGAVADGRLDGLLVVSRQPSGQLSFRYHTLDTTGGQTLQLVTFSALATAILDWQANLPRGDTSNPFQPPLIDTSNPNAALDGGEVVAAENIANRTLLAFAFEFLIFMSLVIYGMWVAQGVVAEKSSRVMELMISAASPVQMLVGKVLGLGAAGLTQYLVVVTPAAILLILQDALGSALFGSAGTAISPLAGLTPPLLLAYGVFFILGFAFYALVYASVGSLASRPDDLQVISFPLALIPLVGYLFALLAITGSAGRIIVLASFVPLFGPFVTLARIMTARVQPWEIALSIGILVVSVIVMAGIAIRVYSAGVLLYGQRPTLRAFIAAARTPR